MDGSERDETFEPGDRRRFLKRAAVGAATVWVAPVVLSRTAYADGSAVSGFVDLTVNAPVPTLCAGSLVARLAGAPTSPPGFFVFPILLNFSSAAPGIRITAMTTVPTGCGVISALSSPLPYDMTLANPLSFTLTESTACNQSETALRVSYTCL